MCLQFWNLIVDDAENNLTIHLKILMNQEVTHIADTAPLHFRMSIFKLFSEHTSRLSNDFDILHNAIIAQNIGL